MRSTNAKKKMEENGIEIKERFHRKTPKVNELESP